MSQTQTIVYTESTTTPKIKRDDPQEAVRIIKRGIKAAEIHAYERHPWLEKKDELALAFFFGALAVIGLCAHLYLSSILPWYFTIPIIGLAVSILHELEHDIIHRLYFPSSKWLANSMLAVIWLFKFHGNPWWRRTIHLLHHKVSGQSQDVEERLLGLGLKLGWSRLGHTTHPLGFFKQIKSIKADAGKKLDLASMNRSSMATGMVLVLCMKMFPVMIALKYIFLSEATWAAYSLDSIMAPLTDFMVILAFPLFLRQSCLVAISTACHYYGDIPAHKVFFQTQILSHWTLYPLQAFCWNFGATHIIHHYNPAQPFFLRPFIQEEVHKIMLEQGVRKNDWGILRRANRWNGAETTDSVQDAVLARFWFFLVFAAACFYSFVWDLVIGDLGLKVVLLFFSYPIRQVWKNRHTAKTM